MNDITFGTKTVRYYKKQAFPHGTLYFTRHAVVAHFVGSIGKIGGHLGMCNVIKTQMSPILKDNIQYAIDLTHSEEDSLISLSKTEKVFIIYKPEPDGVNCLPLSDVEDLFMGTADEFNSHLMWMISRLIKIGKAFETIGVLLPALTYKDIWVNGKSHNVCFMGRPLWDAEYLPNKTIKYDKDYINKDYIQSVKDVMKQFFSTGAYEYIQEWADSKQKKSVKEELDYWDECVDLSTKRKFLALDYDENLIYDS